MNSFRLKTILLGALLGISSLWAGSDNGPGKEDVLETPKKRGSRGPQKGEKQFRWPSKLSEIIRRKIPQMDEPDLSRGERKQVIRTTRLLVWEKMIDTERSFFDEGVDGQKFAQAFRDKKRKLSRPEKDTLPGKRQKIESKRKHFLWPLHVTAFIEKSLHSNPYGSVKKLKEQVWNAIEPTYKQQFFADGMMGEKFETSFNSKVGYVRSGLSKFSRTYLPLEKEGDPSVMPSEALRSEFAMAVSPVEVGPLPELGRRPIYPTDLLPVAKNLSGEEMSFPAGTVFPNLLYREGYPVENMEVRPTFSF